MVVRYGTLLRSFRRYMLHLRQKSIMDFTKKWLHFIDQHLHEKKVWTKVSVNAHMSRKQMKNILQGKGTIENLIRIMINWVMMFDSYEEFQRVWEKLGRLLYDYSNEHGDEYNDKFRKKGPRPLP